MRFIVEWFLLRREFERARAVPAADREAVVAARRRAAAGRSLRWTGHPDEARRLLVEARELFETALHQVRAPSDLAAETKDAPARDATLEEVARHVSALEHRAAAQVPIVEDARLRRGRRVAGALVVAALAVTFAWPRELVRAVGSASYYGGDYPPDRVVDGEFHRRDSEWLLPNGQLGSVRVELSPARKLTRVRLMNARHPPYNSYGAKAFRVALRHGDVEIATFTGEFPPPSDANRWWDSPPLDSSRPIDRIVVHIDSIYGNGGGLAEIAWVEAER